MSLFVALLAGALTISSLTVAADPELAEGPRPAANQLAVPAPPRRTEPKNGKDLLTGGVIMTAIGAPLTLAGLILLRPGKQLEGDANYVAAIYGGSFIGVGLLTLAIGVPLLAVGVHRRRAWTRWQSENRVSLRPHIARDTWSLGLQMRF